MDKLKWTITDESRIDTDVMELKVPREFSINRIGVSLDSDNGRVIFKIPRV